MTIQRLFFALVLCGMADLPAVRAQALGDREPLPRLESGGPTALVTALAFGTQGELYVGGVDKAVRVWTPQPGGRLQLDPYAFRVPIGPGTDGSVNAVALSPDGEWLAVGGLGVIRGGSGFKDAGILMEDTGLSPEQREDRGVIYLFNVRTRAMRQLRGHRGEIVNMVFAPADAGGPPILASMAREPLENDEAQFMGVARVWNVAKGESLGRLPGLPRPTSRPGLAVRRAGPRPNQLRVAIAANDGQLRIWDVHEGDRALKTVADGANNISVLFLPESRRIVTASFVGGEGRVRAWVDADGRPPQLDAEREVRLGAERDDNGNEMLLFPRGLAAVPGKGEGQLAVLVGRARRTGDNGPVRVEDYALLVADLNARRVAGRAEMWRNSGTLPTVACSADGRRLALAGNAAHSVHLLALPLQPGVQPEVFRGAGATFYHVAFVRKGDDKGLLLGATPAKPGVSRPVAAGDLVFDIGKRALVGATGWEPSAAQAAGWQVGHEADANGFIRRVWAQRGNEPRRVVELKEGAATAYALIPPAGELKTPLLAVAHMEEAGAFLFIHDLGPATPTVVRQYRGHVEPIRSLAVSADSRLLASAAEDQTVSVWSLADVPRKLGQFGQLPGVGVSQPPGGRLTVAKVREGSPYAKDLSKGDVIEGRVLQDDQLQRFVSARDFVDTLITLKPGQEVRLRIQGKGDRVLRVGQLADERKPLFSLFLTRGKETERDWLAWTPIGPFDSSGQDAERYLGWHFNPDKAGESTSFALAGEYRDKYYRPGLLRDLVDEADLNKGLKRWLDRQPPPPQPGLTLWIERTAPQAEGDVIVRQTDPTLRVKIDGLASMKEVKSVTWRLDQEAERNLDLAKAEDRELSAVLKLPGVRGRHQVRVAITTRGFEPVVKTEVLTLRYLPPRPTVRLVAPPDPSEGSEDAEAADKPVVLATEEPKLELEARIAPGAKGQAVRGVVRLRGKEDALPASAEERTLKRSFDLSPGENLIEIVAVNDGADKERAEEESASRRVLVTYKAKAKVPPPRIALEATASPDQKPEAIERGKKLVVSSPTLLLTGKIVSDGENLAEARLHGVEKKDLQGFRANQAREFALKESLTLKPGVQKFRMTARGVASDLAETDVTVEYQPPLPTVLIKEPKPDAKLYDDRDKPAIRLVAELTPPADPQPFEAVLIVNDKEQKLPVDPKQTRLEADVPLRPGDNLIQLRLSNAWKQTVTATAAVSYQRPPRDLKFVSAAKSSKPLTDVVATVRSPRGLKITPSDVQATIKNEEVSAAAIGVESIQDPDAKELDAYRITLKDVPLIEGENALMLCVRNASSVCRSPSEFVIRYEKPMAPPPTKPTVEFLSPRTEATVADPQLDVRFRVTTETPLKTVELYSGDERLDVTRLRNAEGVYEVKRLPLQPGENRLRVRALNEGGMQEQSVTVTHTPVPVRLEIDKPAPKVKGSRITLQGHVSWQQGVDDKQIQVRVFVNGAQQPPAALKPAAAGTRRREFATEVELDRKENNRIQFVLPGFAKDSGLPNEYLVSTEKPAAERRRTLHLLLIGVGEERASGIAKRVQQILADQTGQNVPAFDVQPTVLTDHKARSGKVRYELQRIRDSIQRSSRGAARDLVLVYWAGTEKLRGGHAFLTSDDPFAFEVLAQNVNDMLGKRFLFLDVVRTAADGDGKTMARDGFEELSRDKHIAGLRMAWTGKDPAPEDARLVAALQRAVQSMDGADKQVSVGEVARVAEQFKKPEARVSKQLQPELEETVLVRTLGP